MVANKSAPSETEHATKKEMIVAWAQHDPFLKIEDIAKRVKTTAPYVRTALSEANISLTKLRERYARKMEHRLHRDHPPSERGMKASSDKMPERVAEVHTGYAAGIEQIIHPEYADLLRVPPNQPLLAFTRLQEKNDVVRCVHRIVTHCALQFDSNQLAGKQTLRKTLCDTEETDVTIHNRWIQVAPADEILAEQLAIEVQSPVVQCGHVMKAKELPVAVECFLFAAYNTQFFLISNEESEWFTVTRTEEKRSNIARADGA